MPHRWTRSLALVAGIASSFSVAAATTRQPGEDDAFASIAVLRAAYASGELTPEGMTRLFLQRIATIDQSGPTVNSVLETNPDALSIARKPAEGPLKGIVVLLKDNIDTGDRMMTSAGSLALTVKPAPHDSAVAARLRKAGAVILGKTNLSEWANMRSTHATSGWTGRGGLTLNPYVLDRNACGSSAGSGAAIAAGLATVSIGSETDGSIICPASMTGLVGIKPTVGLVSRAGIVPISASQDTAGPMARSVADAAAVLAAIAGSDPRDPATAEADRHVSDYASVLVPGTLRGKRIGVVRQLAGIEPNADRALETTIALLKSEGATVVDNVEIPHLKELGEHELDVLLYEFRHGIEAYLATRPDQPMKTLADLIAFNTREAAREMPWFGQELFLQAQAKGGIDDPAYIAMRDRNKRLAGPEGIDAALAKDRLDALLAPSWGPAFVNDLVLGDHVVSGDPTVGGVSAPAAIAGYPSITLPVAFAHELPVGVVFFGAKWSEPTLIGIAYGVERKAQAFRRPTYLKTLPVR
ncbi:amidase [Luteibacter sp. UNC138MFCol5.1]|uniref:amidase n=1 Tax=Luteibacter sp. UNC138MFCol5.1 TaxID=1502774 RepID=UPI0008CE8D76|nr:amidase [Luteibacter sp. UNC138MFCol5.1]SEO55911.1 amidase [Luteibacter sp. UNC138MFCol5.1]